ncbi:MAG TPA: glycosyltransferase family 39 protein, partial [Pyrinomonadaceae bacterium]|nr:glycosyltransferase family 39 protein [Pyrinomonadaceae bacterium]
MNALLVLAALAASVGIAFAVPGEGPGAIVVCAAVAGPAALIISRHQTHAEFLLQVFVGGLVLRMLIGAVIYVAQLQGFFGGDALTYDSVGIMLLQYWRGVVSYSTFDASASIFLYRNWGMPYVVAAVYAVVGQNMLAVQFFNAVVGAATAPVIFLCAHHIFGNLRVAKLAALFVAFFPSLVLWSSQGLKDGPIVFLLAAAMLSTLRLGERLSVR